LCSSRVTLSEIVSGDQLAALDNAQAVFVVVNCSVKAVDAAVQRVNASLNAGKALSDVDK
jgi:hypothetical protein